MKASIIRCVVLLLCCSGSLCCWGQQPQTPKAPKVGDVVFSTDFEEQAPQTGWSGTPVQLDTGYKSAHALLINNPVGKETDSPNVTRTFPFAQLRGCTLQLSAMIKGENVSAKPQRWNGIKFVVPTEAYEVKSWPQCDIPAGTFDWRPFTFQVVVPDDATALKLALGLEMVSGTVWFDDVTVTVRQLP
jgi:hypothetical protein